MKEYDSPLFVSMLYDIENKYSGSIERDIKSGWNEYDDGWDEYNDDDVAYYDSQPSSYLTIDCYCGNF